MAYTEAKKISNQKSDAKYSQILLKPYKAEATRIKECAANEGMSTQGYILQAVRKQMDGEPTPGVVENSESGLLSPETNSCVISPLFKEQLGEEVRSFIQSAKSSDYDQLEKELTMLIHGEIDSVREPKSKNYDCTVPLWLESLVKASIRNAVQNLSEKKCDKLRYEFDKLIFETFSEELRKPKKSLKTNVTQDDDIQKICHCESLL